MVPRPSCKPSDPGGVDSVVRGLSTSSELSEGLQVMPVINRIAEFHAEMTQWRHLIHAHPETAFEEHKTAELVAGLLESFGVLVDRGIARTGVISTLKGSLPGDRAIAL